MGWDADARPSLSWTADCRCRGTFVMLFYFGLFVDGGCPLQVQRQYVVGQQVRCRAP